MKVYIEELDGDHGVREFSLVRGMDSYTGEVRASGVQVYTRDGVELDPSDPLAKELTEALNQHIIKENE